MSVKQLLRGARESNTALRAVQTAGAPPTFASFAVTRVTNIASTGIRSASVLTDGIDITNGGRSSALVNV